MGRTSVVRNYGGVSASDRRDERRRKLLKAGREVWGGSGIGEVSVRGVCSQAGLISRYFYEQFGDRDELLLVIADQVRDELIAAMLSVGLNEPGGVGEKVSAALKAFLDLVVDDPHVHRIVADTFSGAGPLAAPRRQGLDIITDLILEYGPGLLDFEPPAPAEMRRIASFIVGGVNQLVDAWVLDPRESTAELAEACAELSLAIVRMTSARAEARGKS